MKLKDIDTRAPKSFNKEETKAQQHALLEKLDELQNVLYAESKHALLVILQGMDASGKDGVTKNIFGSMNPLGVKAISFKKPTEEEMKHDFLWRIHKNVPELGMIQIFNRSHYEDVVTQKVHSWVSDDVIDFRYKAINSFEKLLMQSSVTILKFFMHVSYEEQLERLEERKTNPKKMWKNNDADMDERKLWKEYAKAYEAAFENCSSAAEWNIIPADQNWYKEHLIATKVLETLEGLKMEYPVLKEAASG